MLSDNPDRQNDYKTFPRSAPKTHYPCWSNGPGHSEKLLGNRNRLLYPSYARLGGLPGHYTKACAPSNEVERLDKELRVILSLDIDRIGYIYERLTEINAYEAPSRAAPFWPGSALANRRQTSPISSFSGGWRARVALAAALFRSRMCLLLDEPTNHLDFERRCGWKISCIRYRQTLIIISHDRDILNKTVDHIVHLENQKLIQYTGNYDQFERRRAEKLMNQQALHEKHRRKKRR